MRLAERNGQRALRAARLARLHATGEEAPASRPGRTDPVLEVYLPAAAPGAGRARPASRASARASRRRCAAPGSAASPTSPRSTRRRSPPASARSAGWSRRRAGSRSPAPRRRRTLWPAVVARPADGGGPRRSRRLSRPCSPRGRRSPPRCRRSSAPARARAPAPRCSSCGSSFGECEVTRIPASASRVRKALERLVAEGGVADRGDLVDQVPVEGDAHRHAEGEPRLHAGGIGAQRHVHEVAELGEVLDEVDHRLGVHAVDPRDEAHVLRTGQVGVEAAGEAERPGDRPVPADLPGIGPDRPGDHPEQRRLAGAVAAEHPHLGAASAAPGSAGRAPPCGPTTVG